MFDDISSEELPPELVATAKQEELQRTKSSGLYTKVPR